MKYIDLQHLAVNKIRVYKPLFLVSSVLYFADRSLYLEVRSVYLVDWSLLLVDRSAYLTDRSVYLATISSIFLSSAWIWDWSKDGSFSKILFSAIVCTIKITRNINAAISVMFQYITDVYCAYRHTKIVWVKSWEIFFLKKSYKFPLAKDFG